MLNCFIRLNLTKYVKKSNNHRLSRFTEKGIEKCFNILILFNIFLILFLKGAFKTSSLLFRCHAISLFNKVILRSRWFRKVRRLQMTDTTKWHFPSVLPLFCIRNPWNKRYSNAEIEWCYPVNDNWHMKLLKKFFFFCTFL